MALSIKDYTIIKVVQATHHQDDVRYGISTGIQCLCISLDSVSWTLFRSPGLCYKFDLDCILAKGDQLFKFIGQFRYLKTEDLPNELFIENSSVNVEFLENKTGEITTGVYLLSVVEVVINIQQTGTDALLIVNNYGLGLI